MGEGAGAGFFPQDFVLLFFFLTVREPKYIFQDKAKTFFFFLNEHICSKCFLLDLYVRVFLEPQYTWVYCLYVRVYMYLGYLGPSLYEPRHDKTNKMAVRPEKTQISVGIRSV